MGDTVTDNHYTVSRDDADNYKSAASSGDESDTDYVPNSDTNDDFSNNIIIEDGKRAFLCDFYKPFDKINLAFRKQLVS